jgi:hypothetical protein
MAGPPTRPLLDRGRQVHLEHGIREDDAADVTPLDHTAATFKGPQALAGAELGSDLGVRRHRRHGARHLGAADLERRIDTVDEDTRPTQLQIHGVGQGPDRLGVIGVRLRPDDREGDRPVHGARVEVLQSESLGECPADRRLP